jgi:hypothetical protein
MPIDIAEALWYPILIMINVLIKLEGTPVERARRGRVDP